VKEIALKIFLQPQETCLANIIDNDNTKENELTVKIEIFFLVIVVTDIVKLITFSNSYPIYNSCGIN
jgi:hypothetical protein